MRRSLVVTVIVSVLLGHSASQHYPECVDCRLNGKTGIAPLSYTTIISNVFNGTQPTNDGCTPVDGQEAIHCGVGTTLMDCERRPNNNFTLSVVSDHFVWNKTSSVNQHVSVVFRFDQQVDIRRIVIVFYSSPNNNIKVPNLLFYWSNDNSIISNQINFNPASINRDSKGRRRLNLDIDNDGAIRFQYFRIVMSFYDHSEWIFLNEVVFCGISAPFQLTHPPMDGYTQLVSTTTSMTAITCSLNDTIPASVMVTWYYNGSVSGIAATQSGNTATLPLQNLLSTPSSERVGTYQCVFMDSVNGWTLRRSTVLLITDIQITQPTNEMITFNASTDYVQLVCSLDPFIPSTTTIIWFNDSDPFVPSPPNREIDTNVTTTVITIIDPQPSDEEIYLCLFTDSVSGAFTRTITLAFVPSFTEPLIDNVMMKVNSSTPVVNMTCRLSDPIPPSVTVLWSHNGNDVVLSPPRITSIVSMDATVLQIRNTSSSDVGDYQCVFNNNDQWTLRRSFNIQFGGVFAMTTATTSSIIYATSTSVKYSSMITLLTTTTSPDGNSSGSPDVGVIAAVLVSLVMLVIIIFIIVVVILVVWKRKRTGSTKPEGAYYSTIDEGALQTSLPNKPEPIYTEMSDEQNNAKNSSNTSTTQQHVTMQNNPAYCNPKEQVVLQDNPAYGINK